MPEAAVRGAKGFLRSVDRVRSRPMPKTEEEFKQAVMRSLEKSNKRIADRRGK